MGFHKAQTFFQGVFLHHGIGIKQEHIIALSFCNALVICPAESNIFMVLYELYAWKTLLYKSYRAVYGVIVYYDHLCADVPGSLLYRIEALFKEVLDVVIDYDDGELQRWAGRLKIAIKPDIIS